MYARIVRTDGDYDRDKVATVISDVIVPVFEQIPGYCGICVNHQPGSGAVWALSSWSSLEAVRASEELSEHLRQRWARSTRRRVRGSRVYEMPVQVVGSSGPIAGSVLHVVPFRLDGPAAQGDGLADLCDTLLPALGTQDGFRSARLLVDRQAGSGLLTTAWDSAGAGMAAYDATAPERLCAAARGVELGRATTREIIFAHVLTRAS